MRQQPVASATSGAERRQAHRRGRTKGKIGFHGGKVEIERPRIRGLDGAERALPSWENAVSEDWLGKWAMNQMLINVSTRRFKRSVRVPEGDVPAPDGAGLSKSATSRRFVALSAARMKAWMETRLDDLDLLAIQIDGIHMDEDMLLVAAIGVDANGDKHPLGLVEGATENATTVQALIDNLVERGLDPTVRRLFIIDGSKALSKAVRRTFGRDTAIQRCQILQGPQHSGAVAQIDARFSAAGLAASLGNGRRRKGRNAHSQSRPPSRTGLERRFRFDPGRDRRDAHCHEARPSSRTAPLARLHQHHRECYGHGAQGLPKRQILALALYGPAMGRRRHAGSNQGLPSIEGIQTSASSSRCSRKERPAAAFRRAACSNRRGCVNFNAQRPLREFQQTAGHRRGISGDRPCRTFRHRDDEPPP